MLQDPDAPSSARATYLYPPRRLAPLRRCLGMHAGVRLAARQRRPRVRRIALGVRFDRIEPIGSLIFEEVRFSEN